MEPYYNPGILIMLMERRILQQWDYDHPNIPYWRLYWNDRPGARIICQGAATDLTPDRIILVPPNTPVSQRLPHPPVKHFYMHFLTNAPFNRLHSRIYVFKARAAMLAMIKARTAKRGNNLVNDIGLVMAARGLIHYLLAQIPAGELEAARISPRLMANMAFIEAHLQRSLSNAEIARNFGASINTLLRRYQRELGMSAQAYLRQKRIEKACVLLHNPEHSIKQIAEAAGFCDRYHFSRAFTALQKMTPARYRRQLGLIPAGREMKKNGLIRTRQASNPPA